MRDLVKVVGLMAVFSFVATGCGGVSDELFNQAGDDLETEIPQIVHQLDAEFQIEEDLQERDCSVEPRGDDPYDLSRYYAVLHAPMDSEEHATNVLDQAEGVVPEHGLDTMGRYDRGGVDNEIETLNFGITSAASDNFSVNVYVTHFDTEGENVVQILVRSSCVEHADTPREPVERTLDLQADD